jgi:hypothetical protein
VSFNDRFEGKEKGRKQLRCLRPGIIANCLCQLAHSGALWQRNITFAKMVFITFAIFAPPFVSNYIIAAV